MFFFIERIYQTKKKIEYWVDIKFFIENNEIVHLELLNLSSNFVRRFNFSNYNRKKEDIEKKYNQLKLKNYDNVNIDIFRKYLKDVKITKDLITYKISQKPNILNDIMKKFSSGNATVKDIEKLIPYTNPVLRFGFEYINRKSDKRELIKYINENYKIKSIKELFGKLFLVNTTGEESKKYNNKKINSIYIKSKNQKWNFFYFFDSYLDTTIMHNSKKNFFNVTRIFEMNIIKFIQNNVNLLIGFYISNDFKKIQYHFEFNISNDDLQYIIDVKKECEKSITKIKDLKNILNKIFTNVNNIDKLITIHRNRQRNRIQQSIENKLMYNPFYDDCLITKQNYSMFDSHHLFEVSKIKREIKKELKKETINNFKILLLYSSISDVNNSIMLDGTLHNLITRHKAEICLTKDNNFYVKWKIKNLPSRVSKVNNFKPTQEQLNYYNQSINYNNETEL